MGSADITLPAIERDLTIVLSTYRCAPFLPAAIESALHTGAAAILIADDASGLEDPRIAEAYERRYPGRVRLLRTRRRRGPAKNVNETVAQVTTPYFLKLDGADVLVPGYVESAFLTIAAHPTLAAVAGRERRIGWDENLVFQPDSAGAFPADLAPRILSGADVLRFVLNSASNPCSSGVIYRADAFRRAGGFDVSLRSGEDWEIWLRLARHGEIAWYDAPCALFRAGEHSLGRRCFGYDAVVRSAAATWARPELHPLLRRAFFRAAGLYARAASRRLIHLRPDALVCSGLAVRAFCAGLLPLPANGDYSSFR